jgi:hypothetical protein
MGTSTPFPNTCLLVVMSLSSLRSFGILVLGIQHQQPFRLYINFQLFSVIKQLAAFVMPVS